MSISATSSDSGACAKTSRRRPVTRHREQRERGIAVMLTALMMVFTIPIVGLAVDAGVLYLVRAHLTSACDAASLATARNLNMGLTLAQQIAGATTRGNAFFNANFPNGYMGTWATTPTITVAQTNMSTLTVTTTATTNAPIYFIRLLGGSATVAGAVGKASRRDVNLMLVLDRSGSMAGTPCTDMVTAAKTFTDMFVQERDTLGLITYGAAYYDAYPPDNYFKTPGIGIKEKLDQITCGGWTNSAGAYWRAYQKLVAINEPLALNMVVFFTDGVPTAFTGSFPIKTVNDTRYGYSGASCGTGSTCTITKSSCVDDLGRAPSHASWGTFAPKLGVLTGGDPSNTTGDTFGLVNPVATSFSTSDPLIPSTQRTGCAMNTNSREMRRDVANIPDTNSDGLSIYGYQSVNKFSSGTYSNKARPDMPRNLTRIGINLSDNAAVAMRGNTTINPITYTIGLDGNGGIDDVLLRRMANDTSSPIYDNTKVNGLYVYAPNSAQLNAAFARIASEVLRLAQ